MILKLQRACLASDTLFSFVRLAPRNTRQLVPVQCGQVFPWVIHSARRWLQNARKQGLSINRKVGPEIALNTPTSTFDACNIK